MLPDVAPLPNWRERITAMTECERSLTALGGVWLLLVLAFLPDWADMARQWWDSSTYNHILLVPAIVAWLVWQRWDDLRKLTPSVWWPGLLVFAGAALVWVLGAFSGFNLLRHAGAVAMLPASALLMLGPRISTGLAFPLGYMGFLVPFGDELVPPLQAITAELTIALTRLSGIPAAIDGVFIDTPAGLFEVAEACSGVKFLIAMIALGTLAAHVGFKSWTRRVMFMAFAVMAPILANGVRAWGTIQAAQWVGAEKATGFDHIFYGWIFFGVVIALVLGTAWRFFDRPADDRFIDSAAIEASPHLATLARLRTTPFAALLLLAVLGMAGQIWTAAAERLEAQLPARIALPNVSGWTKVPYRPQAPWEPLATGARYRMIERYSDASGRNVDVFVALYASQSDGREAGGFGQGALPSGGLWSWIEGGAPVDQGKSDRIIANGHHVRHVETYYRTGDLLTGSNLRLKLANIEDRLLLRARPTAMLILSAQGNSVGTPDEALTAFRSAIGPIAPWMDQVTAIR